MAPRPPADPEEEVTWAVVRQISLLFLALASPAIVVCCATGGSTAELTFTLLVMAYPVALITLAVAGNRSLGPLRVPLVLLLLILSGCGVAMLVLRGSVPSGPWIGGLPAVTATLLYGLWLLPLPLVSLAYALTFDRFELREDELQRLQAFRREEEP